jgi:hypothetical protein
LPFGIPAYLAIIGCRQGFIRAGVMTVDDEPVDMTPGTAVLTRPGSSHSLKQVGTTISWC